MSVPADPHSFDINPSAATRPRRWMARCRRPRTGEWSSPDVARAVDDVTFRALVHFNMH